MDQYNDDRFNYSESDYIQPQQVDTQQNNYYTPNYQDPNQMYVDPNKMYDISNKDYISPEDNKKANIMCSISLGLSILPRLITTVIMYFIQLSANNINSYAVNESSYPLLGIIGMLQSACGIAALVLMIVVRVKYPKNTFGKVLMWLYIVGAILTVIGAILLIVACASCVTSCPG